MGYVSITYADEYISPNPHVGTRWDALTDAEKTKWIDFTEQQFDNIEWLGDKVDEAQEEAFPRDMVAAAQASTNWDIYSDYAKNTVINADGIIPDAVYVAICESIMAWFRTKKYQALLDLQSVNVDNFKAGSAAFDFEIKQSKTPLPPLAWYVVQYFSRIYWEKPALTILERV